jgi:5'-nucleotidase
MSYKSIFQDVRNAVDHIHMDGSLKTKTCENLDLYVKKDPNLPTLMRRLQQAKRKTFLLTNSEWWYTNKVRRNYCYLRKTLSARKEEESQVSDYLKQENLQL